MIADLDACLQQYARDGIKTVMLGLTDIDGVIRGKYVDIDKFTKLMTDGGGFCDCVFGWDIDDQLVDETKYTGWHTGFPDTQYRLLASTERRKPDTNTPYYIGEFVGSDGEDHPLCPRTLLRRVLGLLNDQGLFANAGFEYEFFVFKETNTTLREKNFVNLTPVSEGNFGYSVLRAATNSVGFEGLAKYCQEFKMALEGLHCETGSGVWEAALQKNNVLDAADQASLFKTFSKVYFQQNDQIATFMAKWSMSFPGQSGHFHFSLVDESGTNVMAGSESELSDTGKYALGGLQRFLPEWLVMLAPTVNSYTRLVKGAWAPTAASWGWDNRTCAFRLIGGTGDRFHVENRVPGADTNSYLVAAATLAACYLGIKEKTLPSEAMSGNAYDQESRLDTTHQFSPTLRDSAIRFQESTEAPTVFGQEFVEHFALSRLWESREAERHVNDWQLKRYFEVI